MNVLGKPHYCCITNAEKELLLNAGYRLEQEKVLSYAKLQIRSTGAVIACATKKQLKRHNSSFVFRCDRSGSNTFAILQKIIVVQEQFYAIAICLVPYCLKLCKDVVTHADLNDHLLTFYPPRYTYTVALILLTLQKL